MSYRFPTRRLAAIADRVPPTEGASHFRIALDAVAPWTGALEVEIDDLHPGEGAEFKIGDILFGKLRPYLAKAWVADRPGVYYGDFINIRAHRDTNPNFLGYAIRTPRFIDAATAVSSGSRMPRTEWASLREISIPIPAQPMQGRIADYLDHETTEIDRFIADQERLSTLLVERRDAVLARTVVSASSDDSASEVPWSPGLRTPFPVLNIRRAAAMRTGHTPNRSTPEYWAGDRDIPWFTLADVWQLRAGHKYLGETREHITHEGLSNSAAELLPAGTVVLSRTASVGFAGIMPNAMATTQHYWNWVPGSHLDSEYLWLQFRAMRPYFSKISSGATHKTIYDADAAGMEIVLPPLETQREIVAELTSTDVTTEALISDSTRAIALAKERRAALITAAVTGQIDVTAKHRPAAEQLEDDIKELT